MDENAYPTKTVLKTASCEGEDMGKAFVDAITEEAKIIYEKILKNSKPMIMTKSDKMRYARDMNCYACEVKFGTTQINEPSKKEEKVTKCRDHCHITGKYRGAACDKCNLQMRIPNFIPVLFHNLEGYDSHLFVKSLGPIEGDIRCIPKTDEKYISFSKMIPVGKEIVQKPNGDYVEKEIKLELRFIDSLKFTLKSLDSLVKTLGSDQFETLTSQMIPLIPKETLNGRRHDRFESLKLLKQKGVFPYEYMTDHPLFSKKNKKQVGFMKDECGGIQIVKFVGLRSKLYSYETADGTQVKKCKEMCSQKRNYHSRLRRMSILRETPIQNDEHHPEQATRRRNWRMSKKVLSADDDKLIIQEDGIHTLAIGHDTRVDNHWF